jgi:hypothetical protein
MAFAPGGGVVTLGHTVELDAYDLSHTIVERG